jgi:hypothetical protein
MNYISSNIREQQLFKIKLYLFLVTFFLICGSIYFIKLVVSNYGTADYYPWFNVIIILGISFLFGHAIGLIPLNKEIPGIWIFIGAMSFVPILFVIILFKSSIISMVFLIGLYIGILKQIYKIEQK